MRDRRTFKLVKTTVHFKTVSIVSIYKIFIAIFFLVLPTNKVDDVIIISLMNFCHDVCNMCVECIRKGKKNTQLCFLFISR